MTNDLVSVIIPAFNRKNFVVDTLESVLAQTYRPLEIIVVDNGSTDGTLACLERYADRILLRHEPKSGMGGSYARNTGLDHATGEFIAFLDSDDLWMPTKIEKQVAFLEQNQDVGWCYTDLIGFDSKTDATLYRYSQTRLMHTGEVLEQTFVQIFTPLSTLLIRRTLAEKVGRFWPTPKGTDADFAIRLAAESSVGFVSEVLARYRVHNESVTGRINGEQAFAAGKMVAERAVKAHPDRLTPLLGRTLSIMATAVGLSLLKNGENREARKMFVQAIRSNPADLKLYLFLVSSFLGSRLLKLMASGRRRTSTVDKG